MKKPYSHLNIFLLKEEYYSKEFADLLSPTSIVTEYELDDEHRIDGRLFIKVPNEKKPKWSDLVEKLTGTEIEELSNKSSSAVLLMRFSNNVFAFTFGYGRFLIDTTYFVQDFGIKTALNTLNHDSLRSVDLHTLEDQAVQKKTQAARSSEVNVFGIDISKDVLRAVTGSPRQGVNFKNISGGDAVFSFGIEFDVKDLPGIANQISNYYKSEDYKANFAWVDNIRKIKDWGLIESLDLKLIETIKRKDDSLTITVPEIIQWDSVYGFSFTRSKNLIKPTIVAEDYLGNVDVNSVSIDTVKRDKLHIFDIHDNEFEYSIYKCLYLEVIEGNKTYVLFAGMWYEIDNTFIGRINQTLNQISICELDFPTVYTWSEDEKSFIESEGSYNERAASENGYYLLDKKLVKSSRTTSSIELCDLLTAEKQLIHVKHRKGGSSGLSHLFAQGNVSAEILLGDKEFRKASRKVLKKVNPSIRDLVPLNSFKSNEYEIVYLILGQGSELIKETLPFFSKVNLTKAYENLTQRGFKVSIGGCPTEERPHA